ncbi:hypothetical protein SAMN05216466_106186 [Paraburkholderia phenazinium]|uniref:Uncharacterized protein n=1 Tax=Paraburkholderia phenazinium TaxID=60549 RepID=A0A1G7YHS1_9BURK|nr:hypothetical protein [Paraburkholderia phenazinium]SDG95836.1 hypothetical protein SAMN05216466_106186 [Paraburkholderia phenazinium]
MRITGRLNLLGEGHWVKQNWTRRAVIEVGDVDLRNIVYSPYLASYIEGSLNQPIALGIQKILGGRSVVAVATADGRVRREGPLWNIVVLGIYLMLSLLLDAIGHGAGWGVLLFAWLALAPIKGILLARSFAAMTPEEIQRYALDERRSA